MPSFLPLASCNDALDLDLAFSFEDFDVLPLRTGGGGVVEDCDDEELGAGDPDDISDGR